MGRRLNTAVPALSVRRLRKVYGGTVALGDVDVEIQAGEIHGLLGENGAGKSTLVKLIAGIEPSDGGSVSYFGTELPARCTPELVGELGVRFIHQNLGLVEDLSVAENIALACGYSRSGPIISWRGTRWAARTALGRMGVDLDVDTRVGDLPVATRSVIAIARALAQDVRLLVLDEPTATLGPREVETLFGILRRLRDQGVAIVLITHRLDEVIEITDRVTVLRDGKVVGVRDSAGADQRDLVRMIIGTDLPPRPERSSQAGDEVVNFTGVFAGLVGPLDFSARGGEVLGITGLSGAGHSIVPQILMGDQPIRRGTITVSGTAYSPNGPADAVERGISLVPADRNGAGAVPSMELRENLYLNPRVGWRTLLRRGSESATAAGLLRSFDVRPPNPGAEFSTLSGGNAQKVVLARALSSSPRVLVLEEPTAAVDIGARAEIHRRIREIAASGPAVIIVSSDLEEIEQVCDRALVMERGHIRGVLEGQHVTAGNLLESAYGVHVHG